MPLNPETTPDESSSQATPQPVIPHPDKIAAEILSKQETADTAWAKHLEEVSDLRKQLRLSCKCYGVDYHDPSVRKKVKAEV